MNLVTCLMERAAREPERPALVETRRGGDQVVTYGELAARVAGGARAWRAMGMRPGDTVWLMQPVSMVLYEMMLAAFHAGMRVMLADPRGGREFLGHCRERARPVCYAGPWRAHLLRWSVPELRVIPQWVRTSGWMPATRAWSPQAGEAAPEMVGDDEPALITFTSGSTGQPKAAVRTHGLLLAQHRALVDPLDLEDGGVDLITLPVFVLANLASGLTSVLAATDLSNPGHPDAAAVVGQCRRLQVTRCTASPAFFAGLLAHGAPPPLEKIFTGGGPVFPDFVRTLRDNLPDAAIHAVYGSTEAEPISHAAACEADGGDGTTRAGGGLCAGLPAPGTTVRIIPAAWGRALGPFTADEFAAMALPCGQAGEIVVAGAHVLPGYLDGVGDSATKIPVADGVFHRTGDAGWLDRTGRIWLLGRAGEMLPIPGRPVPVRPDLPPDVARYPFAVECALREEFPGLRTAALNWRESRLLVVEVPVITEAIRLAAARWEMADIVALPALPLDKRHHAKLDYPALRGMLEKVKGHTTRAEST